MDDLEKNSDFLFYNSEDGNIKVQVIVGDETVWTTQKSMGEIFGVESNTITYHIAEIYNSGELDNDSTTRKIRVVQREGNRDVEREVQFYNLDMIIAVGYRVNSYNATKFRKWATGVLKEYLIKGFILDDERLKQANNLFNKDYFKELLQRIRDIRASEKMFYEKVKELYATSVDYDKNAPETIAFFGKVQNKLEYAIVGKTAAEIIKSRANAKLPNMNLKTWKNAKKDGELQKSDVTVAKNYLEEEEIRKLNLLVNAFLDYAEMQAERNKLMKMSDWIQRVDAFLRFNDYRILIDAGSVSKQVADKHAEGEYAKYKIIQVQDKSEGISLIPAAPTKHTNDFDKQLKGLLNTPPPKKDKG